MAPPETSLVAPEELAALRASIEAAYPAYLDDLERLVNTDCGSYTKAGVDAVGRFTAERLRTLGFAVTSHENDQGLGETVIGELHGTDPAGPTLLCIGHMDTVFDPGSAEERPFAIQGGIATGPGVTDMKSGLLTGLYAIAALRDALDGVPHGAPRSSSPTRTRRSARPSRRRTSGGWPEEADACLVLECARANGDIVSSRKGSLDLRGHRARQGEPRRDRAREGPQRDPRGGPDHRRTSTRSTAAGPG